MINKRIWQVSLVVGALMALAGVAAASEHEDTVINSGYDEENHILVFNTSSTDGTYDCTLQTTEDPDDPENTEYTVTYAFLTEDGLIEVEGLTNDEDETVSFSEREGEGEALYGETNEECDLQAVDVTGPVGQVNHGTFVSAIATLYEGPHRGCVISHFARSDLGKGEQQINGPQESEDPDAEPVTEGTVQFTTIVADCERTTQENGENADNGEGRPEWAGQGRPDWAGQGRPAWAGQEGGPNSAGKSGSAPGRDR